MCITGFLEIYLKSPSLKRLYQFNEGICLVSRLALNLIRRLLTKRRSHTIILQGDRIELVGAFSYWWDTRDFRCWKRSRGSSRKEAWVEREGRRGKLQYRLQPQPLLLVGVLAWMDIKRPNKRPCNNGSRNKEKDLGGDLMRQGLGFPWLSMTTIVF